MFRFFKGKWVGEDELKEKEKLVFKEKTGFVNIINDKQRMILEFKQEVLKLKDEFFKKKDELINIINEKEKTIQELRGEVKLYQIQLCDLKEAFGWRGE